MAVSASDSSASMCVAYAFTIGAGAGMSMPLSMARSCLPCRFLCCAIRGAADSFVDVQPPQPATDPDGVQLTEGAVAQDGPPHFGPEALLASVESGAIAPLRGSWVVVLHERGGTLQRRQDLPPEAFFPAAELRELVAKLGEDYGLLFVALSYCWLGKDEPDPDRFHLHFVAIMSEAYLQHLQEIFASLIPPLEADFALFWYPCRASNSGLAPSHSAH